MCVAPVFDMNYDEDDKALACLQQRCLIGLLYDPHKLSVTKRGNLLTLYVVSAGMLNLTINAQRLSQFQQNINAPKMQEAIRGLCNLANIDPTKYPGVHQVWQSFHLLQDVINTHYESKDKYQSLW